MRADFGVQASRRKQTSAADCQDQGSFHWSIKFRLGFHCADEENRRERISLGSCFLTHSFQLSADTISPQDDPRCTRRVSAEEMPLCGALARCAFMRCSFHAYRDNAYLLAQVRK